MKLSMICHKDYSSNRSTHRANIIFFNSKLVASTKGLPKHQGGKRHTQGKKL